MRPLTLLKFGVAVVLAGLLAGVALNAQRSPQGGGVFIPGADYDLAGNIHFTGSLTDGQNPVTVSGTQTLTNKTLTSPTLNTPTITGGTITIQPIISGAGSGTATLSYANTSTSGTFTIPSASSDTFVTLAATQTLTNKTLTSPTLTTPVVSSFTNTGTVTMPSQTGSAPVVQDCQSTGTGNQTCTAQASTALAKIYEGKSTLASNAATITFSPGFTTTNDFMCVANDVTTRANPVQMVPASATTATITNTTGASDVIQWICIGQ